jgi:hypothetical protein
MSKVMEAVDRVMACGGTYEAYPGAGVRERIRCRRHLANSLR